MAKRQVSIQDTVETEEDFQNYIQEHHDQLICMEVYCEAFGHCLATGNAIRKGKLEIGMDDVAMVKACADTIDSLARFRDRSEPTFIFIMKGQLIDVMFGADGIKLCQMIEDQIHILHTERDSGVKLDITRVDITERLPAETKKAEEEIHQDQEYLEAHRKMKTLMLAARKKRITERLAVQVKRLNFIMFWPKNHQAHYDLYEKWDMLNLQVAAKEEVQLTEDMAREALYMSDVDLNEACLYHLLDGQALLVLFKMFDTDDRDFVQLMRHALYEEIPEPKEDVPPEKQLPPIPAFERYATISKTAREVRRERYNAKQQKLREEEEERQRLIREQERMAREAKEAAEAEEKQRKEEERMARLAAGLPASPEPEPEAEPEVVPEGEEEEKEEEEPPPDEGEVPPELAEELPADEEVLEKEVSFHSDVEVEDEEYIPPGGLFVPGLYSPPNELAKANALKLFFPKIIGAIAPIETEFLPPHVLVMFNVDKRNEVADIINTYASEILNIGFFVGDDPYHAEHVAYTIKQYDKMIRLRKHLDRMAVMVSRKRSLPLLQLAGLNPCYISSDVEAGERDCLSLFPVEYGDNYIEEESVHEEEVVVEVVSVKEEVKEEAKPVEEEEEEGEEEDI